MKNFFYKFISVIVLFVLGATVANAKFYYSYIPKKLHPNQVFSITIVNNQSNKDITPTFVFDSTATIMQISNEPVIAKSGKDYFYTFYFKVINQSSVTIPKVTIKYGAENFSLDATKVAVTSLQKRDDFSGIFATDMKIKTYQVSQYDDNYNLVTISFEAFEANLEDIKLNGFTEEGLEDTKRSGAKVEAEYFGLVENTSQNLYFTYYNTIQQNHIAFELPLHIKDASAAGQLQLNPKDDSFEMLKQYTFMVLVALFFGLFLIKKDFFYFFLGAVSLVTLITFFVPHQKICVSKGSLIYILPTQTSTVSAKVPKDFQTMQLGQRDNFVKIEFSNGAIGWVLRENLCKN